MGPGLAGQMTDNNEEASYRRESRGDTPKEKAPAEAGAAVPRVNRSAGKAQS